MNNLVNSFKINAAIPFSDLLTPGSKWSWLLHESATGECKE